MPSQIQYTEKEREKRDLVDVDAENDFYHHFNFPLFGLRGESVKNEKMSELFFRKRARENESEWFCASCIDATMSHDANAFSHIYTHTHTTGHLKIARRERENDKKNRRRILSKIKIS